MPKSLLTTMVSKAIGGGSNGWQSAEIELSKIKGDVGAQGDIHLKGHHVDVPCKLESKYLILIVNCLGLMKTYQYETYGLQVCHDVHANVRSGSAKCSTKQTRKDRFLLLSRKMNDTAQF